MEHFRTPTLNGVQAAQAAIPACFRDTPQVLDHALSAELGCKIILKLETQNPIRSFKGRGAEYLFSRLEKKKLFVCASAGNFGQGVAYAASRRGLRAVVFVAEGANELKVRRMRELGATVMVSGSDFDAAKEAARKFARAESGEFLEDGRNPEITEGAGTIGAELSNWPAALDIISCPVGNGALINGIGLWMRAFSPQTEIIGVCAAGAPAMALSWRCGSTVRAEAKTIADGISVREPVAEALALMSQTVDDAVLVEEEAILDAMRLLYSTSGLIVEPAGVAGLAAILSFPSKFKSGLVAVPLCGSNVTQRQAAEWLGDGAADHLAREERTYARASDSAAG